MATQPVTLNDLLPSFERHLRAKGRSPRTITNYVGAAEALQAHRVESGLSAAIEAITRADIEKYTLHQIETRSPSTAATRFRCLQQVFKWLTLEGELESNPMDGLTPPAVPEAPVDVYSSEELKALLDITKGAAFEARRDHAIIRTFIDTGVRVGEMAGIAIDDVDLDRGEILVKGKGNRSRFVPLGYKAVEDLDRYLRERRRHNQAQDPHLWVGVRGKLSESGISQLLRRRGRQAGVENVRPHRFRHTFAHQWLAGDGNEGDLQALAGWKSNQMIQRYGASARSERARDAHRTHSPGDRI